MGIFLGSFAPIIACILFEQELMACILVEASNCRYVPLICACYKARQHIERTYIDTKTGNSR